MKVAYAIITINQDIKIAVRHQATGTNSDADIARAVAQSTLTNTTGSYGYELLPEAGFVALYNSFPSFDEDIVLVADNPVWRAKFRVEPTRKFK